MEVSFSAWSHAHEESLVLNGDSFSFLFDRRYTNRLNRMSRVFFEAYVKATKELASQEDRFPSLSEIDAKMESGAVYAFKDRLMKNTEFFEEVKISGVSYLVPRAERFIDASGTYADLVLDFEIGSVTLPTRRKTPAPVEAEPKEELGEEGEEPAAIEEEIAGELEVPAAETAPPSLGIESPAPLPPQEKKSAAEVEKIEQFARHVPEPYAESSGPSEAEEEPIKEPISVAHAKPLSGPPQAPKPEVGPAPSGGGLGGNGQNMKVIAAALVAVAILLAGGAIFFLSQPTPGTPSMVKYFAYLSNSSNESYLGLDIGNLEEMPNELEMKLPKDIDRSISARGGVVSISHTDRTIVRLNSTSDASVRIYLAGNWTYVPVDLSLTVPEGYDSGVVVLGKDYLVTRKDDTILLSLNITQEGVDFEQSYSQKR